MNQVSVQKTKILFAVLFLASSLLGCFHPFGKSIFERIQTKDGKVKVTVKIDPGLSVDHVYVIHDHKYFNRVPKSGFAHFTDTFFISEKNGCLTVTYRGVMIEDKTKSGSGMEFVHIESYDKYNELFQKLKKGDVVFSYPSIK